MIPDLRWCASIICNSYILRWGSWDQRTRAGTGLLIIDTLVPVVGVEPTRCCHHEILSLARLPIPSHRHIKIYFNPRVPEGWSYCPCHLLNCNMLLNTRGRNSGGSTGRRDNVTTIGCSFPFWIDGFKLPKCSLPRGAAYPFGVITTHGRCRRYSSVHTHLIIMEAPGGILNAACYCDSIFFTRSIQ